MGSCGRRFGRNVPLEHTFPDTANLMTPSPRLVSRELMTRTEFQPAHDPEPPGGGLDPVHGARLVRAQAQQDRERRDSARPWRRLVRPRDEGAAHRCPIRRPPGSTRPPAYANPNSHWWDGSQIYGSDPVVAAKLRTGEGGKLKLEATKLLPVDPDTGVQSERVHRQLVDRARDAPHDVHARAQLHLRSAARESIRAGATRSCTARPSSSTPR